MGGRIDVRYGDYAIFDDYIILSQSSHQSKLFLGIMETSTKNTSLIYYLSFINVHDDAEKTYHEILEILELQEAPLLKQKLQDIYQRIGAKQLLHEIYLYVFDDTEPNDQKFIERLEKL